MQERKMTAAKAEDEVAAFRPAELRVVEEELDLVEGSTATMVVEVEGGCCWGSAADSTFVVVVVDIVLVVGSIEEVVVVVGVVPEGSLADCWDQWCLRCRRWHRAADCHL
jgi:hypothetical protein